MEKLNYFLYLRFVKINNFSLYNIFCQIEFILNVIWKEENQKNSVERKRAQLA